MDDLRSIGAWMDEPPPVPGVTERGYQRLIALAAEEGRPPDTRSRPGRRRMSQRAKPGQWAGWLVGGAGLAAAASAVAVVAASTLTAPTTAGGHASAVARSSGTARLAGQRILLAAATSSLRQRPGTYWHFKISMGLNPQFHVPRGAIVVSTFEDWVGRGSTYWTGQPACAAPAGTVVRDGPGLVPGYDLGNTTLSYQQTRHLPTRPAALEAWVAQRVLAYGGQLSPHERKSFFADSDIAYALLALQWQVPAPPQVRAAAFRALAAFPGVKSLGAVKGGQALLISFPHEPRDSWLKVVVDPATSLVRTETSFKGTTRIEIAQWTNRLPRVVPLPSKTACGS